MAKYDPNRQTNYRSSLYGSTSDLDRDGDRDSLDLFLLTELLPDDDYEDDIGDDGDDDDDREY